MIELVDVCKTYQDKKGREVKAVRGVNHKFPKTGLVFIVGKSGSGKSTLLNLLGLLDDYDSGQLLIDGKPSKELSERERDTYRALNIGFVFQEFHIIEKYTIGQNISLALEIGKKQTTPEQIASALEKVGLGGFENRFAREVSGGQKQRVAIARALIKSPKVILADEPTGSLDSVTSREIFELLKELGRENLVVVITHDVESAHTYADEIIEIADGRIVDVYNGDGTTDTIRLAVDSVNKGEVDKLINSGKKVILVKKQKPKPPPTIAVKTTPIDLEKRVRLPFRSSFRLSLLAMRAKWVRVLFTIFLSMTAVALFGLADVIGGFHVNNIMVQELERSELPFVSVALMEVDDDSFIPSQNRTTINPSHLNHFRTLNIPFAKQNMFPLPLYHPSGHSGEIFGWDITSVIELEKPEQLGLTLSEGRWPTQLDEVVITNFILERIKANGFSKNPHAGGIPPTPVNSFECVYNKDFYEILNTDAGVMHGRSADGTPHVKRIVGMIEFDISAFDIVFDLDVFDQLSRSEQQEHFRTMQYVRASSKHSSYFALPGFYNDLVLRNASLFNAMDVTVTATTPNHETRVVENAQSHFAPLGFFARYWENWFRPGFSFEDDFVNENQVIITPAALLGVLPEEKANQFHLDVTNLMVGGHTFETATLNALWSLVFHENILDGLYLHFYYNDILQSNFEVIAVHPYLGTTAIFMPSSNFFHAVADRIEPMVGTVLVSAQTYSERMHLLSVLNQRGRFTGYDEFGEQAVFNFVVWSENAQQIYYLDNMFMLFVSVFNLAAILLMVFSVLLTYSFIASSINARKKDIGILRSLGASQRDVALIFVKEGVIVAVLMALFASVAAFVGFIVLNNFFVSQLGYIAQSYTLVTFGIRQIALMSAIAIASVAVSTAWPILRIARKHPVQVIRD